MRNRLLLGPVMILMLVLGLLADQWLDQRAIPPGCRDWLLGVLPTPWAVRDTWPPGVVLFCIAVTIAVLASRELAALLRADGIDASKRMLTTASIVGLLVSCLVPDSAPGTVAVPVVSTAALAMLVMSMVFHSRNKTVEGVIASTGGVLLSFVYLGVMFGFMLAIRREHHALVLLWVLLTTKSCDIGALFTGKAIGRHKLIPWLSPGKTWEGLVGGVVTSSAVCAAGMQLVHHWSGTLVPDWWHGAVLGALLGLTGQVGDLLESVLKRDAGSKDSGRSIPGYGGILDLIDSPLLTGPVAFWWLEVASGRGYFQPV
ncbi:MAG: phosphatidate cytidylyltransferase [Phycisphaerales bacterium]